MSLRTHFMMVGNLPATPPEQSVLGNEENYNKWRSIHDAFTSAGATVELIEGYDPFIQQGTHIYCRDQSLILGGTAYMPDPDNCPSYTDNRTLDFIRLKLENFGYEVLKIKGAWFEGGNILRHDSSRTLFVGIYKYSPVTNYKRLLGTINDTQTEKWNICPVSLSPLIAYGVPSTLLNARGLYHLDLGLTDELPNGEVLVYPDIADKATIDTIGIIVGKEKLIPVTNVTEVYDAALNLNYTGNTVILTSPVPETTGFLKGQGYEVITPDQYGLQNFSFGDAGVHCFTNELRPV